MGSKVNATLVFSNLYHDSHSGLLAPNSDETRGKSREDITSRALLCSERSFGNVHQLTNGYYADGLVFFSFYLFHSPLF